MSTPIRPIRGEVDYRAALAEIEALFDSAPDTAEADRMEVLTILVEDYETRHHALPEIDPVSYLDFAMRAQGRSQADLAQLLGSRSRASEILHRKRALTSEMIDRIASAWSLPPALLAAPYAIRSGFGHKAARAAGALIVALGLTSAGIAGTFWHYGKDLPDTRALAAYDAEGSGAAGKTAPVVSPENFTALADIPAHVVKAFLAAEDQNYYAHGGYDAAAIARAVLFLARDGLEGRHISGAATITQQLAKNMLLAGEAPSLERKIREIILARRLEQSLSKDRILELYLNAIYFGGTAYGIGPAAHFYFGKRAGELTMAEAAYLAALPKAPNFYRIDVEANRQPAKERRNWVLARMAEDGLITEAAARFAQAEPLLPAAAR